MDVSILAAQLAMVAKIIVHQIVNAHVLVVVIGIVLAAVKPLA
jgi:hypothetical protein